jgi:hypothetical protein
VLRGRRPKRSSASRSAQALRETGVVRRGMRGRPSRPERNPNR